MIRHAEAADSSRIAQIHIASWQSAYAGLLPDDYLAGLDGELEQRIAQWEDWLSKGSDQRLVLVAEDEGELVGFAHAGPAGDRDLDGEAGEIYAIYLHPDHVGHGWGKRLMSGIEEYLRAAGFERAALWVMTENQSARDFYEHLGWKPDGTQQDHCMGLPVPAVRYQASLSPPPQ